MKMILPLAAFAAALLGAPAAYAQPADQLPWISVNHADLDLTQPTDRTKLGHRLASAARAVCGTASDADIVGKNNVQRCRVETLALAIAQRDQVLASVDRNTFADRNH